MGRLIILLFPGGLAGAVGLAQVLVLGRPGRPGDQLVQVGAAVAARQAQAQLVARRIGEFPHHVRQRGEVKTEKIIRDSNFYRFTTATHQAHAGI